MKNRQALTSEEQTWKSRYALDMLQYPSIDGVFAGLYADMVWNCDVERKEIRKQVDSILALYDNVKGIPLD